jgi:hypothetical protein
MNTFVRKLIEFADYCGKIDNVSSYDKEFASVEGKLRDGTYSFSISICFKKIEQEGTEDGN